MGNTGGNFNPALNAVSNINTTSLVYSAQTGVQGLNNTTRGVAAPQGYGTQYSAHDDHHQGGEDCGEVITENYNDGSVYIGQKMNGYRHGKGKFYYADGGMYDGEWKYGSMDGYGKLYYVSGKLAYEGEWREDKFCGKGVVYNEVPVPMNAPFRYENFDTLGDYWLKYEGEFYEDNKEGLGTLFLTNNECFTGEFRNDVADGKGTFHRIDGTVAVGEWRNNQLIRHM
eukprot:TRINITY_DN1759_c0_g1_i4.p1 TRINITY_DN1759_c0_g1~~TRINITY_DN1759_c0_g1_i4.p1  ORF type:complete len:227 (+),score=58.37 TRINITY_DN1759_c0_g1_i4:103-783(+)